MIMRLSTHHPPDRLDFFRTQILFPDKNFNPNPTPTSTPTQPQPNPNQTYSQTRVWHCKPSLFPLYNLWQILLFNALKTDTHPSGGNLLEVVISFFCQTSYTDCCAKSNLHCNRDTLLQCYVPDDRRCKNLLCAGHSSQLLIIYLVTYELWYNICIYLLPEHIHVHQAICTVHCTKLAHGPEDNPCSR